MLHDVQESDKLKQKLNLYQANSSSLFEKDMDESRPSITSLHRKENEQYHTFSSIKQGNEGGEPQMLPETPARRWPNASSQVSSVIPDSRRTFESRDEILNSDRALNAERLKSPFQGIDINEESENDLENDAQDSQAIDFNSFYVSENEGTAAQDMKMPDYGSMKDRTPGETLNQEDETFVTHSEFESSKTQSQNKYESLEGTRQMLRIKKRVKMERLTLKNLGVCFSPTKTDLAKVIFLDSDCNQIRYVNDEQVKTKWQFIDPRNRKNYRLFVQCLSVFDQNHEKPKLDDELRQIEQNFYYYCMFEGIDIASEFHLLPEVK